MRDAAPEVRDLPHTPPVARMLEFEASVISTVTPIPPATLEAMTTEPSTSQGATPSSASSAIPEPLSSKLTEEEFEALKAQLIGTKMLHI